MYVFAVLWIFIASEASQTVNAEKAKEFVRCIDIYIFTPIFCLRSLVKLTPGFTSGFQGSVNVHGFLNFIWNKYRLSRAERMRIE